MTKLLKNSVHRNHLLLNWSIRDHYYAQQIGLDRCYLRALLALAGRFLKAQTVPQNTQLSAEMHGGLSKHHKVFHYT